MQCPGAKGVFIRGMGGMEGGSRPSAPAGSRVRLGSSGFWAPAGMAQAPPNFLAPGIRPSTQ